MARLVMHIGTHKTGTTSLQVFFADNVDWLASAGICYPVAGRSGNRRSHHNLAGAAKISPNKFFPPEMDLGRYFGDIRREMDSKHLATALVSSERFSAPLDFRRLQTEAKVWDEIQVIVYLRRQDRYVESSYFSTLIGGSTKSFAEHVTSRSEHKLAYYEFLSEWAETFGRQCLVVRPFESRQWLGEDLIHDFCAQIGIQDLTASTARQRHANSSPSREYLQFFRLLNRMADHADRRAILVEIVKATSGRTQGSKCLFDLQSRIHFLERFRDSNERVAREYLGRQDGVLFYDPLTNGPDEEEPISELTLEGAANIVVQLMKPSNPGAELPPRKKKQGVREPAAHRNNRQIATMKTALKQKDAALASRAAEIDALAQQLAQAKDELAEVRRNHSK